MPSLKNIFLSVLLLTVASMVKGDNATTVTLFDVVIPSVTTGRPVGASAVNVEPNGGTAYLEYVEFTETVSGSAVTTTQTHAVVEAASWQFLSVQTTSSAVVGSIQQNCTLQGDGTIAECVEIVAAALSGSSTAATATFSASVVPFATFTATSPIPTSSTTAIATNAATSVKNHRLPSFVVGILFIMMLF